MRQLGLQGLLLLSLLLGFAACKKDNNNNGDKKKYVLMIENGPTTVQPGASLTYRAILVDEEGTRSTPNNVTWTSSSTETATISAAGVVSIGGAGVSIIRASVSIDGNTLTAEAPLNVRIPGIFAVAPSAILVDTEFPDIQLEPVYLGTGSPSYAYSSSNAAVASVSSTGLVDFKTAGSCEITVTANGLDGTPSVVVPVLVIGVPQVELPVVRVEISPSASAILRTETAQFTAKAFNSSGSQVNTSFTWSIEDPNIATVDANGLVTPVRNGTTNVRVMASGIVAQAELTVVADQVLVVSPYYASIAAGASRSFTALQHPVQRVAGELVLGNGVAATGVQWVVPTYGIPMLDVASVDANGNVTVRSDAMAGMATAVIAEIPGNTNVEPGGAMIIVAIADPCDCGTQNANATQLVITSPSTITVGFGQQVQIQAEVRDAAGNAIPGAAITYCSQDLMSVNVDSDGNVSALSIVPGTTTVRVCHGGLSQTVTVNY